MAEKTTVIIVCAGTGKRLGKIDKAVLPLAGKPLFYHTFCAFALMKTIDQIILVLRKKHFALARKLISDPRLCLVEGGLQRKDSVLNGLLAVGKNIDFVLIHDGARPLISRKVIALMIRTLKKWPAVICGVSSKDTVKIVEKGVIRKTLPRENIFLIQTPQGFHKTVIEEAYKKIGNKKIYDDAQAVELRGGKVRVIDGNRTNMKITYPEDVDFVRQIMTKNKL